MNSVFIRLHQQPTAKACELIGNNIARKMSEINITYNLIQLCLRDKIKFSNEIIYLGKNATWVSRLLGITRRNIRYNLEIIKHLDARELQLYDELETLKNECNRWITYYNEVFINESGVKPIELVTVLRHARPKE